jgi:drug/metabolite transporter (DMT)-like permease
VHLCWPLVTVQVSAMNARLLPPLPSVVDVRWVVPALAAVYLIWGSTYLAMRVAVEGLPPFFMASSRFLASGGFLLLFLRLRGAPWPSPRQWWSAVPVGTLMFVLGNGTVALAERNLSSGVAAVVCGTMPLGVAALGPLFGERATPREWFALVVGFLGVAVLGLGGEVRGEPWSAALLVLAPLSWALGSLLARRLPLAPGLMSAATQMVTGGAVMALVSPMLGESVPTAPPLRSLLAWAYLVVFGSLIAYSAYTYLLRHTRPALATSHSYVNPALAVVLGAALGGERVGVETVVAVVLIIVATLLVVLARRSRPGR